MSVLIGDFWQSKQYPKIIYHVDNFSINLKKAANLKKEMFIICSELLADTNGSDNIEKFTTNPLFVFHTTEEELEELCTPILTAKRITKDTRTFKTDKDILDYLTRKVEEKLNAK